MGNSRHLDEKRERYGVAPRSKRRGIIIAAIVISIILIVAIVLAVYFTVIKPKNKGASGGTGDGGTSDSSSPTGKPVSAIVTGGDGSQVTTESGETFKYSNSFGGYWYWDENDPFNNGARAQSWTPALNETFKYGIDKIRG
jgi:glucan 1,3-beta-glucosidase